MLFRFFTAFLIVGAVVVASVGVTAGVSPRREVVIRPCRLTLPPAQAGLPAFAIPKGGSATQRLLAGQIRLCTLLRADGSTFALAQIDRLQDVLEMRFFRTSGRLLFAADSADAALGTTQGAQVSCGSSAYNHIGRGSWRQAIRWWVGKTPTNLPRAQVVNALRAAQAEWNNNINWCNYPAHADGFAPYQGSTTSGLGHNGINTVDWGRGITTIQGCTGAGTIACTLTWYDQNGTPTESDVRFSTRVQWSTQPRSNAYDIQSLAAHEFGHVRQLAHVTSDRLKQYTLVMWPYFSPRDTTARKLGRGDAIANNRHI
jgi:hypothetical protein